MEEFESYRPLLFSIAYRMTGLASEAEDIVQDAYLRYHDARPDEIHSLKSYLSTIVTRLSIDYMKSAHAQREQYIGPWLPEPLLTTRADLIPLETVEQRESLSLAFMVLLETLTPPERAVFLLHEVFDYNFREIAAIIGKNTAYCRQLFHRAKQHVAERRSRFPLASQTHQQLMMPFLNACQSGDLAALLDMLAQDVTTWADSGGKVRSALRPIYGRDAVARLWLGLTRKALPTLSMAFAEVNGHPAALLWDAQNLAYVVTLDAANGLIHAIRVTANPDKLAYIARQLATDRLDDGLRL